MVGKLFDSRDFLISIPADSSPSNLMFLKNSMSSNLVETGASVSVFPHHPGHPPAPNVGVQHIWITPDSSPVLLSGLFSLLMCPCPSSDLIFFTTSWSTMLVPATLDASTLELISAVSSVEKPGKLLCNLFNGSQ